ncbi:MAG: hypothetical protein A2X51_10615 [Candidatus Rokubacteria bacterium GWC2_70_24]|nr:MAG: hypothetical protein A2X53_00625 [Candidatus Rokubacteria bacterium GWA2_70_23]OGK87573.1 MAG: hypothetical protein A2X51_10615 [Candidatus Rokubacteria bacterium GWC2_70_24]OGK90209.1 MAG: hypothetical protein A2X50_06210 [Candidatus Rokubacteria bacterium GWF2_70_14]HAM55386.1 hypothetical protein [Candidatus Rokubacteria bacterium]
MTSPLGASIRRTEDLRFLTGRGRYLDDPMVVEGQLHGGIVQGIGSALTEERIRDDAGQLLTGSLMAYGVPTATQVPPIEAVLLDHPSVMNVLGIKGVGESGVICPAAAMPTRWRTRSRTAGC